MLKRLNLFSLIVFSSLLLSRVTFSSECPSIRESLQATKKACGYKAGSEESLSTECESEITKLKRSLMNCLQNEYDQRRSADQPVEGNESKKNGEH